jgi:hypothetical protein
VSWIKSSVAQMKWHPFVKVLDSVNLKDFWADYETKIFKNEVKPFELPRGVGKMKWEDMLANDSIPIWYFIPCRVLESRDYYLMAIITVKKNIYREKLSSSMNEVMLRKADQKLIRGKTEWGGNFNFSEFRKEYGAE